MSVGDDGSTGIRNACGASGEVPCSLLSLEGRGKFVYDMLRIRTVGFVKRFRLCVQ